MTPTRKYSFIVGGILIGLIILIFGGLGVLTAVVDEISDNEERDLPFIFGSPYLPWGDRPESVSDELTGQLSAILFIAANSPIVFSLLAKQMTHRVPPQAGVKDVIQQLDRANRKHGMRFHTYLNLLAPAVSLAHLSRSTCQSNPLPEWGLVITGVLAVTGVIIKLRVAPRSLRKNIYQFHISLVVSGILLVILLSGHLVMD